MPKLNRDQLFAWHMPLPPLIDQKRIASQLNEQMASASQLYKKLEEQLESIKKLPTAILRRAFNGEL